MFNSKKLVLFLILLCTSPAWATWTLLNTNTNNSCSGATTCAITMTSTGSGHLLVAEMQNGTTGTTISSFNTGCNGSWVISSATLLSATGIGSAELAYCTNSTASITSITITISTTFATGNVTIWEASSSLGNIALDSGGTPANTQSNSSACTTCTGVSLTLSGNNDFFAFVSLSGGTCSAVSGTGMVLDNNDHGNCEGHGTGSGSQTVPVSYTQTSGQNFGNAIAFQESATGTATPRMMLVGVGP